MVAQEVTNTFAIVGLDSDCQGEYYFIYIDGDAAILAFNKQVETASVQYGLC